MPAMLDGLEVVYKGYIIFVYLDADATAAARILPKSGTTRAANLRSCATLCKYWSNNLNYSG